MLFRSRIIQLDLLQLHTSRVWIEAHELPTKTHFYRDHFLRICEEGFITRPQYLEDRRVSPALRIAIGQMRVSSHQLEIEVGRATGIPRERRLCRLCTTKMIEIEEHLLCFCPVYYEIHGRYHCLFLEGSGFGPLTQLIHFYDQVCVGLYRLEMRRQRHAHTTDETAAASDHSRLDG